MRTSDRLKLRRGVAGQLSGETWAVIDETLEAFGVPTNDRWDGRVEDYILVMTREADDSQLLELARHLGVAPEVRHAVDEASDIWKRDGLRVFFSHVSQVKELCCDVSSLLGARGIRCFVAHVHIETDKEWQRELERALGSADCLVAFLTDSFRESAWTDQEVGFALGRGIPVTGVRLPKDPHGFIGKRQGLSIRRQGADGIADALFESLGKSPNLCPKIAKGLLANLAEADSFHGANRAAKYLSELEYWDARFNPILAKAIRENAQVSGAYDVPRFLKHKVEGSGGTWPD